MAITEKELLVEYVSKALNIPKDGVAALIYNADGTELNEDALSVLMDKQKVFVKKWKDDTSKFDQGYNKAKAETLKEFEKTLREKFEIDSDKSGLELIEEYVDGIRSKAGSKDVTDDDVKKHKLFLDTIAENKRQLKAATDTANAEVEKLKATYAQEKTFANVTTKALEILEGKKPILSQDPAKAARQKQLLLNELKQFSFEVQGEGEDARIVVLKDGKVHENKLGHAIEFDELVNTTSDLYYDFEAADDRSAAGDPNKKGGDNKKPPVVKLGASVILHGMTLKKPLSEKEFTDQYMAIQSNKELKPEQKSDLSIKLSELNKTTV